MAKSKTPVKLVSYEEIMGIGDYEEVVTIAIDDIRPFKNHSFLFQVFQHFICGTMFISGFGISRTFHKRLLWNIVFSDAIDNNVYVDISGTIMTIWMGTNDSLMTRKIP